MAEESESGRKPTAPQQQAPPAPKETTEKAPKEHRAAHEPEGHKEARPSHEKEGPREAPPKPVKPAGAKKKPPAKPARPKAVGKTNIGIDVKPPTKTCTDRHCPFHGRLPVRGQVFEGLVVSDGMDKSAVIRRERMVYVPKYERYLKRTSRMSVHSPPCLEAKIGDWVTVMECRPLSKTISFTMVSKRTAGRAADE